MTRSLSQGQRRRGFTLMEVLVVLAILVMLVGMAVPKILERYKQSNISNAKIQIGAIKQALEHYYMDVKAFPTPDQGLQALVEKPSDLDESVPWAKYMDNVPNDPWGHPFQYAYDPGDDKPRVWSMGPDGQDGTDDDVSLDSTTTGDSSSGGTGGGSKTTGSSSVK